MPLGAPSIRILSAVIILPAALYLGALAWLYVVQRSLVYFPDKIGFAPRALGLDAEVRHIKTADGETLLAWWFAPKPGRPLILYFRGSADGLDTRAERFKKLVANGDGLLVIEYRGYQGSTGHPTEAGLLLDGEAAYAEALKSGIEPRHLVVMGESLGTGVAVALAADHEVGAVVLDSPYTSVVDVAAERYWMFPIRALVLDSFRSDLRIGKVRAPLLIVHGALDDNVPTHFGEQLFALANEPKRFIKVEGAGHLALGERVPETLAWIDAALGN